MNNLKPIKEVITGLKMKALGGAKIPHGLSNPVLRRVDDKIVIAIFIHTYKKENLDTQKMPRPAYWMTADIETGEMLGHFTCEQAEFSNQPYDKLYSSSPSNKDKINAEYFVELYKTFDEVRNKYINTGKIDENQYGNYLSKVLDVVPIEYGVFYKDLSNI